MSRRTARPCAATSTSETPQTQLRESVVNLRQPTRELLFSMIEAAEELRQLALGTSSFAMRAELFAHGLASDQSMTGRCKLTALGLAALELDQPVQIASGSHNVQIAGVSDSQISIDRRSAKPSSD